MKEFDITGESGGRDLKGDDGPVSVVVLGGAQGQLACISACRRLGLEVVLVDPRADVPGAALAERWISLDVLDTSAIVQAVAGLHVAAVLTDQSDYSARGAAALAAALGLPGQPKDVAEACSNKLVMRQKLAESAPDLVPWFQHVTDAHEAAAVIKSQDEPVVIKPLQSQGSRGVKMLFPSDDLSLLGEALAESAGFGVLVEQAIQGREYSVDGYVQNGVHMALAIASKTHYAGNPCLDERCDFLPATFVDVEAPLLQAMQRIVTALRIDNGIVHAELMMGDSGIKLVEIALRGGGSDISGLIVPFLTGFDPAEAMLRHWLGLPGHSPPRDFRERCAILRFLPYAAPSPARLPSLDVPGWASLVYVNPDASPVRAPRSSAERAGAIILTGATEDEVRESETAAMRYLGYPEGT